MKLVHIYISHVNLFFFYFILLRFRLRAVFLECFLFLYHLLDFSPFDLCPFSGSIRPPIRQSCRWLWLNRVNYVIELIQFASSSTTRDLYFAPFHLDGVCPVLSDLRWISKQISVELSKFFGFQNEQKQKEKKIP